ncbi:SRPBCC domain-containing protein [Streptomyces sp. NPDC005931]|uniref:SRPBCC domain-containing protein n=1 Tax=Streptomyces sp. NPDC005931 TaxID=3364737 RepID=UPI003697775B
MEHEVSVPVPVELLREVLDDPARVARAVPGLQHDAGSDDPVAGRLKVRVGSHSITYRGAVRISAREDGSYAVEGDATETRGSGTVALALRLTPWAAEGGAALAVTGTATADGRITEFPPEAVTSAVSRLLTRFAEGLATVAAETAETADAAETAEVDETAGGAPVRGTPDGPESPELLAVGDFETRATTDFETTPDADDTPPPPGPTQAAGSAGPTESATPSESGPPAEPAPDPSVFDTDVPPPSLDPYADEDRKDADDAEDDPDLADDRDLADGRDLADDHDLAGASGDADADAVAEAAHARRTMIGRSAEEVDHAPPRGRYAPVPAPQTVSAPAPLRWAAPAAALAVASAVVVVRVLRRRR